MVSRPATAAKKAAAPAKAKKQPAKAAAAKQPAAVQTRAAVQKKAAATITLKAVGLRPTPFRVLLGPGGRG
jgi:hypothetical protein